MSDESRARPFHHGEEPGKAAEDDEQLGDDRESDDGCAHPVRVRHDNRDRADGHDEEEDVVEDDGGVLK